MTRQKCISIRGETYAAMAKRAVKDGLTIGALLDSLPLPSPGQVAVLRANVLAAKPWTRDDRNEAVATSYATWQGEPDLPMTIEVDEATARGLERIAKRAGISSLEAADRVCELAMAGGGR